MFHLVKTELRDTKCEVIRKTQKAANEAGKSVLETNNTVKCRVHLEFNPYRSEIDQN